MTSESLPPPSVAPPTELAEAVQAQIREARDVLRADAAVAGIEPQRIDAAVDAAAATYTAARVHAFIGILVERDVRAALRLAASAPAGEAPVSP